MSIDRARNRSLEVFVTERPWGQFEQFVSNEMCTVKIITVQPGHRLSLQTHGHRDEMWQVLDVPIDVQVDDRSPGSPRSASGSGCRRAPGTGWATAAPRRAACSRSRSATFDECDIERLAGRLRPAAAAD